MKKTKKIPKRKNVSQKIKNGTVILTRDEFFQDNNNYIKPKYQGSNTLYREATVVDSNRNDELAVIKHQSSGKFSVKKKNNKISKYNTYIKTKDNEGKPIKIGEKFKQSNPKYGITEKQANKMKKKSIKSPNKRIAKDNRIVLKELKGRKK
ncbi:MAG: hypothetical protein IKC49_03140 [Clostridia bacterium]|nr:hypothetical protein [Clostridia bacterium]